MTEMRAEVAKPPAGSRKDRVVADPGTTVVLKAVPPAPEGSWVYVDQKGQAGPLPSVTKTTATDGTLEFVMDKSGNYAGTYYFKSGQQESNPVTVLLRQSLLKRLLPGARPTIAAVVIYAIAVVLAVGNPMGWRISSTSLTVRAYLFAAVTLGLALFLVYLAGKLATEQNGLARLVQGADRRASTSKVQYLLWTLGVAFALSYILGRVLMSSSERFACTA